MLGLSALIDTPTEKIDTANIPNSGNVNTNPPQGNNNSPQNPTNQSNPVQNAATTQQSTTPVKSAKELQEDYELVGEINACTAAFLIEAPLYGASGFMNRKRKKKIEADTKLSKEEKEEKIKAIRVRVKEDAELIDIDDKEMSKLQKGFTALAKLKGTTEPSPSLMIASAFMGIALKRFPIFLPED